MPAAEGDIFRIISQLLRQRGAPAAGSIQCAFADGSGSANDGLELGAFVRALRVHGVGRHVQDVLPALDIQAEQSSRLEATMRVRTLNSVRNNLKILAETISSVKLLEQAGVQVLALKGAGLSQRLYGDPAFRQVNDCDLLVAPSQFSTAAAVLTAAGYADQASCVPMGAVQTKLFQFVNHDMAFVSPDRNVRVELHWRLSANVSNAESIFRGYYQRHVRLAAGAETLPVLAIEDEFPYLIVHGAGHDWCWLKWLVDVEAYLDIIPPETMQQILQNRLDAAGRLEFAAALFLCRKVLGSTDRTGDLPEQLAAAGEAEAVRFEAILASMDTSVHMTHQREATWHTLIRVWKSGSIGGFLQVAIITIFAVPEWKSMKPPLGFWPFYAFVGPYFWLKRTRRRLAVGSRTG